MGLIWMLGKEEYVKCDGSQIAFDRDAFENPPLNLRCYKFIFK